MPNDARNADTGQFAPKYEDEEFIEVVVALEEATTREVADRVGADHDTARRRLNALADEGHVDRRRIAATIVWSVAADE